MSDRLPFNRRALLQTGALFAAAAAAAPMPFLGSGTAAAAEDISTLNGAGFYKFNIGAFKATVVSDGYGDIPFWPIFASNQSEETVKPVLEANYLKPTSQFTSNILVIDTEKERVLVDTGFGEVLGPQSGSSSSLIPNLRRAGITPESIDVVVITHAHVDHIGGIISKTGALVFPNARYVFAEKEWAYWTGDRFESDVNGSPMPDGFKKGTIWAAKNNLPPIKDKVQLLKADGEVVHGLNLIAAPGHSPAQSAILIASGNDQLIHMADVAHRNDTGLQHPEWSILFDYDNEEAIQTRKKMLDRVATDRTLVLGYHFPFPAIGHVERSGGAYRWNATSWVW
jgi:glyoxylase-like metal-dependent hydrolase (beta-lactamase superfamily II)